MSPCKCDSVLCYNCDNYVSSVVTKGGMMCFYSALYDLTFRWNFIRMDIANVIQTGDIELQIECVEWKNI